MTLTPQSRLLWLLTRRLPGDVPGRLVGNGPGPRLHVTQYSCSHHRAEVPCSHCSRDLLQSAQHIDRPLDFLLFTLLKCCPLNYTHSQDDLLFVAVSHVTRIPICRSNSNHLSHYDSWISFVSAASAAWSVMTYYHNPTAVSASRWDGGESSSSTRCADTRVTANGDCASVRHKPSYLRRGSPFTLIRHSW